MDDMAAELQAQREDARSFWAVREDLRQHDVGALKAEVQDLRKELQAEVRERRQMAQEHREALAALVEESRASLERHLQALLEAALAQSREFAGQRQGAAAELGEEPQPITAAAGGGEATTAAVAGGEARTAAASAADEVKSAPQPFTAAAATEGVVSPLASKAGEVETAPQLVAMHVWRVVGGGATGGILVRKGMDTDSPTEEERLSTGAEVKQLALLGDRLQYERISGTGPLTGWVSVRTKEKLLLQRVTESLMPGARAGERSVDQGVLRPSCQGTEAMRGGANGGLQACHEVDAGSAVTCMAFGQERLRKRYILLAAGTKDRVATIYRCYRTAMELEYLGGMDFPPERRPPEADDADGSILVHARCVGHSRPITSCSFSALEDQLMTTSIDKTVRFWVVETGELVKLFTDGCPVPVATFLPSNPQVVVASNSNADLRLVNVPVGVVLQKLKMEAEVRALAWGDTGSLLLAGTTSGSIHALEASRANALEFNRKLTLQLGRGGVTCLRFVPAGAGQPPCCLVNAADSSVAVVDCTYCPAGQLKELAVRFRVPVAHSLLPLRCCHSPSGRGYLISGSEDHEVCIFALGRGNNPRRQGLKHHGVPVVAVAVNAQDTLLASGDFLGRIVLWRRMDFSHLPG